MEVSMESIVAEGNMWKAYKAVTRNKGAPGIDGITTKQLGKHLKKHWPTLRDKLCRGEYRPCWIKGVRIPKPQGGERLLGIPTSQDRVIQQATQQELTRLWDAEFSEHSYGYRPGRSAHDAIRAAQGYIQAGKSWVVDVDIESFFDHVNHDRLMNLIGRKVKDNRVLRYIGNSLRADMVLDGQRIKRIQGTPQGGPLSPVLANLYLDALDKELEKRELSFCRYADDLMIFVNSERSALRILTSISAWIETHLKLKVSASKSGTGRPWDKTYLGYTFDEGGMPRVSEKSKKKYQENVRKIWSTRLCLAARDRITLWQQTVRGWYHYFKLATDNFKGLSQWTRRHIRKFFWLRWHSKTGRMTRLQKLGIGQKLLSRISFHAKAWRASRHQAMHTALSLKRLREWGLWTPEHFLSAKS